MKLNDRYSRRSVSTKEATEHLLDAGKRVLCLSPGMALLKKRKGHLTLIETVQTKKTEPLIFYDEFT